QLAVPRPVSVHQYSNLKRTQSSERQRLVGVDRVEQSHNDFSRFTEFAQPNVELFDFAAQQRTRLNAWMKHRFLAEYARQQQPNTADLQSCCAEHPDALGSVHFVETVIAVARIGPLGIEQAFVFVIPQHPFTDAGPASQFSDTHEISRKIRLTLTALSKSNLFRPAGLPAAPFVEEPRMTPSDDTFDGTFPF